MIAYPHPPTSGPRFALPRLAPPSRPSMRPCDLAEKNMVKSMGNSWEISPKNGEIHGKSAPKMVKFMGNQPQKW